ncbi:MAG: hypothetical protein EPO51_08740 [Phenylobacterium sp.]|uniref:DUF6270 domain-containing protein n=1 Tax=Phenylobacterium sp. TaxID=1871053 RepID=UPI00120D593C|nr:DUF6270 domain-containing protein [Phenylobacterium sp.]TAJ72189.1 MAG: hypothetical protein EPO51_08740 [Phenylobacterium sp.]
MPRIAIVGSCITRDLWPIRGGGAEALLYISRTSFPGLLSAPVQGFRPDEDPPAGLRQHEHNALVADIRKTALTRLIAYRPTHVIFDFIDERFDLLSIGGALASSSDGMVRSGYRTQPALGLARTIPRLSDACERLWLEAASEFAAVVRATPLHRARLILHSARWAERQRSPDGRLATIRDVEIVGGQPAVIADYNALLDRQEAAFAALMPPMARVDAGPFRLAEAEHRWGLSPFHYIPEYYDEVRRQLAALGLEDSFSDRLAEPSVPAA